MKTALIVTLLVAISPVTQARDLYLAPADGWVNTRGNAALITFEGLVAQGMFEKMPDSAIVPDPEKTCSPLGITKSVGGVQCVKTPGRSLSGKPSSGDAYVCEMAINLTEGSLMDRSHNEGCGEDRVFLKKEQERSRRQGYWSYQ
jgi:hypothetical protein